ncbi:conserved oligomeric Golgi complex subunit 3-like isoform X2 [Lineus longissimus]|uniref:conserved oligomeric Golgi complex subunit 3-like isoform X2 n=1 Tax=Lineus longissimus TaxID=88925 RepID=UPI002B4E7C41
MADTSPSSKMLREKLASWDALDHARAPLSDRQRDSIMDLTTMSSKRPLPIELPLDEIPGLTTHIQPSLVTGDDDIIAKGLAALNLAQEKVENAQQFFFWFSEIEERIDCEEDIEYRSYLGQLGEYQGQCDQILTEVSTALTQLTGLMKQYVFVSTKTNALHEACEHLMAEQTKLVETAECVQNKLSYFNELDKISSRLGAPTLTVTSDSFVPTLSRIDECIAYLNKNSHYKESSVYLARFRQCLSKALNLIKIHVVSILQNATQNVQPRKDSVNAGENAFTLFYGKFRTNAPRVKNLMEQIEQRIDKSPEYKQLLSDCHQCYFSQRATLLGPSVSAAVTELASKHSRDHCALMRSGCAFMVHVCEDEYQLYHQFFTQPTPQLDVMLEGLCNSLYDVFRPLIIHVQHLETLSELCSILKIEMMEEHVCNNPDQLGAFETMCSQLLEDVQERLVYRTYIYIKSDILNYKPAEGDLAYPEKLEMMESIAESLKKGHLSRTNSSQSDISLASQEVASITADLDQASEQPYALQENGTHDSSIMTASDSRIVSNMPMSPADMHGMWYPTVRRALVCLSKLSRCIDTTTFQGLSQEALYFCVQSLLVASNSIRKRKTVIDGQLFLIKHLLILREQIAPFHVDFAIKEKSLDFSKFKDAAYGLIQKRGRLFSMNSTNSLLQFLLEGTPHVTEYLVDSKKDVDNHLKTSCEEFIHHATEMLTGPMQQFCNKANVIIKMNEDENAPTVELRNQPFASPEKLHDVVAETYRLLKNKVPVIFRAMVLYLANKDTEYILFKPIKVNVQQQFQNLNSLIKENYSEEDQQIIGCPSIEQVNLLLSSKMSK